MPARFLPAFVAAVCLVGGAALWAIAADDDMAARKVLRAHGLVQVGPTWLSQHEIDLRMRLDSLDALEKRFFQARTALEELFGHYRNRRALLESTEENVRRLRALSKASTSSAQKKQLDEDAEKQADLATLFKRQLGDPSRWGELPPLKAVAAELSAARIELILATLAIRRHAAALPEEYRRLQDNGSVQQAIAQAGGRLGSTKTYQAELKQLAKTEQHVLTDWQPLYRESSLYRLACIAGDETPVTFSLRTSSEPNLITASMASAIGLKKDPQAPQRKYRIDAKRTVSGHEVRISHLRFGRHVLREVDALLLPPEAEDLGSQLGSTAFAGYRTRLEEMQLRFILEPDSDPSSKEAKSPDKK